MPFLHYIEQKGKRIMTNKILFIGERPLARIKGSIELLDAEAHYKNEE